MDWKNVLERAAWTFVQAFASAALADGALTLSIELWQAAALAGIAAVLSLIKTVAQEKITW